MQHCRIHFTKIGLAILVLTQAAVEAQAVVQVVAAAAVEVVVAVAVVAEINFYMYFGQADQNGDCFQETPHSR